MKILYYYSQLNIGGAERSTVRLLNAFAERGHDVTLLLRWDGGLLEVELSKKIKRIHLKKAKAGKKINKIRNSIETIKSFFRAKELKKEEYDVVISGLFGYNPKILFQSVKGKQYYQLLRNDVEKTGGYGKTIEYMDKYGERFDAFIGVSKYTTQSFINVYPQFKDRAHTIYNILPAISKENFQSEATIKGDKFNIVTVCRLVDKAKGLFRMVRICKKLNEKFNDAFRWYVVGEGSDREELKKRIVEENLEEIMIMCGETDNPFPYYKSADLVAVLSYYEGLCGVVNEAKMMEKPVIATKFSAIDEQILDGVNGFIVENKEDAIIEKMSEILSDRSIIEGLCVNGMPSALRDNEKKVTAYEELQKEIEKGKGKS